jgi:hypothetical protein
MVFWKTAGTRWHGQEWVSLHDRNASEARLKFRGPGLDGLDSRRYSERLATGNKKRVRSLITSPAWHIKLRGYTSM